MNEKFNPMNKKSKTKWVVWFNNKTNKQDDEWRCVRAHTRDEATNKGKEKLDPYRFTLGPTYSIKEARARFGKGWPF